jgi:hypothetical protein
MWGLTERITGRTDVSSVPAAATAGKTGDGSMGLALAGRREAGGGLRCRVSR